MPETNVESLPWSVLPLSAEEIPWSELRTIAEAAAESAEVRRRLMHEFNALLDRRYAQDADHYANLSDLSILAVFALAAERMNDEARAETAEFIIEVLRRVGEAEDYILMEALINSGGRLGPAMLEPALRLMRSEGIESENWHFAVTFLATALEASEPVRQSVIGYCRRLIHNEADGFSPSSPLVPVLYLLAEFNDVDSLPLLRGIARNAESGDLDEVIAILEGRSEPLDPEFMRPWLRPVEEWLPQKVKQVRDWLAEPESGDADDEPADPTEEHYALVDRFAQSEAFAALPEPVRERAEFTAVCFLRYMWSYCGAVLRDLEPPVVEEVLLEWFPAKVSAEKPFFEYAPHTLDAFLRWLGETGAVADPAPLIRTVWQCADEMLELSQDPRCWGMAKSFVMSAMAAGVNTSDPAAMERYSQEYVVRMREHFERRQQQEAAHDGWPARPIVRDALKVGRNDPCPCGSGRKFKKCCGRDDAPAQRINNPIFGRH